MARVIRPTIEQWRVLEALGLVKRHIMEDFILIHPQARLQGRAARIRKLDMYLDDSGNPDVRINVVWDETHPQVGDL